MGLGKGDPSRHQSDGILAWLLPIMVVVIAGGLALSDESASDWLRFDRLAIVDGEIWRLLTGHFVHLGIPHYLLNCAGLLLVWYLVGARFDANSWLLISIGSIIGIDLGFWLFEPQLTWYVGLSGVVHGLLAAGIVGTVGKDGPTVLILAVMLAGKLGYEQFAGPLPGSENSSGGAVIVNAHLYGAIAGALTAAMLTILSKQPRQSG